MDGYYLKGDVRKMCDSETSRLFAERKKSFLSLTFYLIKKWKEKKLYFEKETPFVYFVHIAPDKRMLFNPTQKLKNSKLTINPIQQCSASIILNFHN